MRCRSTLHPTIRLTSTLFFAKCNVNETSTERWPRELPSAQPDEFAESIGLIESPSAFNERVPVAAETIGSWGAAIQSLYIRKRRWFGGRRDEGRDGPFLQFSKSPGELHRAHKNSAPVSKAGRSISNKLVSSLATRTIESVPRWIRENPGGRVSRRMVSDTEQRGIPSSADRCIRSGSNRRQSPMVRQHPRADLLLCMGSEQFVGERSEIRWGARESADRRERLGLRGSRQHELVLLVAEWLCFRDGLIRSFTEWV